MTDRQAQYRASKAKSREAKRNAGLVPLEVWVPHDKVPEVKAFINVEIPPVEGRILGSLGDGENL